MKLLFALHSSKELDNSPRDNSYTISVLLVSDVKHYSTTLYLISKEWEIYLVACHEKESIIDRANERIERFELLVRE